MKPNPNKIEPMEGVGAPPKTGAALVGLLGAVAVGGLMLTIPEDEGTRYKAYRDVVGVWTICQGDTKNVAPGMVETKAGCQRRLEDQLLAHAKPVMACTPALAQEGRDHQRWAAVSLAYNIGVNAYCRSSVDRHFDAGNWRAGCDAFLKWRYAGGKVWPGLVKRREREREICLRGLA